MFTCCGLPPDLSPTKKRNLAWAAGGHMAKIVDGRDHRDGWIR